MACAEGVTRAPVSCKWFGPCASPGNRPMLSSMALRALIPEDQVVELAEMFRLMSDPTRLKIILACLDHPAAVGEMADRLTISASLVSHHLRLLRAARLLHADRRGRQVFYVVGDPHIRSMLSDMVDHVAEGDAEVEADPAVTG